MADVILGDAPTQEPAPSSAPSDGTGNVPAKPENGAAGDSTGAAGDSTGADVKKHPEPVIPEKYDVKLPEGAVLEPEIVEATLELAKKVKLTNEQAQALVELRNQDRIAFMETQQKAFDQLVDSWAQQARADPEIVGERKDQFDATVAVSRLALDRFASPTLRKMLHDTGYGNHPEVIKLFARIGKAMKEDAFHRPDVPSGPSAVPLEEKFYGKH